MAMYVKCYGCGIDNILPGCECLGRKLLYLEGETEGIYIINEYEFNFCIKLIKDYNAQLYYHEIDGYKYVFLRIDNIRIKLTGYMCINYIGDESEMWRDGDLLLWTSFYADVYKYLDDNGYRSQILQLKFVD